MKNSPTFARNPRNLSLKRVVVTGIGLVSPLGIGTEVSWQALLAGQNGIVRISRFEVDDYSSQIAGEVKNFNPLDFMEKKEARKMDLFIQYAMAAAQLAVEDAAVPLEDLEGEECGVYVGSGIGGIGSIEDNHKTLLAKGPSRVSPFFLVSTIINEASGQISIRYRAKGPNSAIATEPQPAPLEHMLSVIHSGLLLEEMPS